MKTRTALCTHHLVSSYNLSQALPHSPPLSSSMVFIRVISDEQDSSAILARAGERREVACEMEIVKQNDQGRNRGPVLLELLNCGCMEVATPSLQRGGHWLYVLQLAPHRCHLSAVRGRGRMMPSCLDLEERDHLAIT